MADRDVLLGTRWKTQAWKQILGRVAQLAQVVDGVLKVGQAASPASMDDARAETGSGPGLSGAFQRRLRDVQVRTTEKSEDLRHWVLQPFADLRERAARLPGQTERLAEQVTLLELLLDLEIAEIAAFLGEIPTAQMRIVGMRVAASVVLPELAHELAEAKQTLRNTREYIQRLEAGHAGSEITDDAYGVLLPEYLADEARSRAAIEALESRAEVWRRDGRAVLDACDAWMRRQLEVVAARRYAERRDAPTDTQGLLRRERARLEEVRVLLSAL